MANFFRNFPKIRYKIDGTETDVATNIFFRLKFIEDVKNNAVAYFTYFIKDGETPEIIAEKYYGNSEAHWIILMMNDIVDPQYDWPLDYRSFNEYIISKYGSVENAQIGIHHSEMVIKRIDNDTGTATEKYIEIDTNTPNANISSVFPYNAYDFGSLPLSEPAGIVYTLPSGSSVREMVWKRQKTIYDFENELNEGKRKIKLLNKIYYSQVMAEFNALAEESNAGLRTGLRTARI
jgi:Base plate wedge protein 53